MTGVKRCLTQSDVQGRKSGRRVRCFCQLVVARPARPRSLFSALLTPSRSAYQRLPRPSLLAQLPVLVSSFSDLHSLRLSPKGNSPIQSAPGQRPRRSSPHPRPSLALNLCPSSTPPNPSPHQNPRFSNINHSNLDKPPRSRYLPCLRTRPLLLKPQPRPRRRPSARVPTL
jgi:hypothetical protein